MNNNKNGNTTKTNETPTEGGMLDMPKDNSSLDQSDNENVDEDRGGELEHNA